MKKLVFSIEERVERFYSLNEEESKKVLDKAFELAKENCGNTKNNYLSYFLECATQLLLDNEEIVGKFLEEERESNFVGVWEKN